MLHNLQIGISFETCVISLVNYHPFNKVIAPMSDESVIRRMNEDTKL